MRLAILTPFEGKGWALEPWLASVRAAGLPEGTELLWLCNSADDGFYRSLEAAAATVPERVTLWRDTERIDEATPMIAKDSTVARLWREIRSRIPADVTHVLCLEDDVIIGADTLTGLLALCPDEITVVGSPVPEYVPTGLYMAWLHVGDPAIAKTSPRGDSPAEVDALSFGCTLYPRSLFDQLSLRPGKDRRPPFWGYDNCAGEDVKALGGTVIAAWNLPVEHLARPGIAMPAAPAPSSPAIFSTPEREWLRLSAVGPNPDWPALQRIARTALDYGKLRRLAGLHQLDGVVAWRLCDEHMDGVAPNIVREHCQGHLDWLNANRDLWLKSGAPVFAALNASDLPWITAGGPVQYAPLALPDDVWPRVFDHFILHVPEEHHLEACRVMSSAGAVEEKRIPGHPFTKFHVEGFMLVLGRYADPQPASEIWERSPQLFTDRYQVVVQGTEMWTPSPEWMVCWLANHTGESYGPNACPLPLWGLARVQNWRTIPGYSFSVERMCEGIRAAIACSNKVGNWGQEMLFGMQLTAQAYGFEIPDEFAPELAKAWVTPRCLAPEDHRPQDPDVLLEIDKTHSAETILFTKYTTGVANKEAAGLPRRRQTDG